MFGTHFLLPLIGLIVLPIGAPSLRATPSDYSSLVPKYDLSIKLIPEAQRIEVTGIVTLPVVNAQQELIPTLLSEQMRDFQVEILQPTSSAGRALVEAKGKSSGRTFYVITPSKPIPPNTIVQVRFSYVGGEKGGFVFHLGPDGSFAHGSLGAWYPLFDAGEYTGHVGTMSFSVPSGNVVVASGKATSSIGDMAKGEYRFDVSRPAVFAFAAAKYTIARRSDRPLVAVYQLKSRSNIDEYLVKSAKVLEFLSSQFGRYPNGEFSLVEIPTDAATGFFGASSPGIIFIPSKFIDAKYDYSLHGHEIGHQWWGGLVGTKGQKGGFMMGEGLTQFGSLLTVEKMEGEEAARNYRQVGYPSIGKYGFSACDGKNIQIQSLHGYLMLTATGDDQRLDSLHGELAHGLAVSKGFLVLDLLSRTVGRKVFQRILITFTKQHAYKVATWEEFLRSVEVGTGRDLKWFYSQWFERTGAPDLAITWKQEGNEVRGVITQTEPLYQLKLEVVAESSNGKRSKKEIDVNGAQTEFTMKSGSKVSSVVVDPLFYVPHWTPEYKAEAEAIKRCATK